MQMNKLLGLDPICLVHCGITNTNTITACGNYKEFNTYYLDELNSVIIQHMEQAEDAMKTQRRDRLWKGEENSSKCSFKNIKNIILIKIHGN